MTRDREQELDRLKAIIRDSKPKFELGNVVATPGALEALERDEIDQALARHHRGDWGELDHEDNETNDQSLESGDRILSAYTSTKGVKFWIITEAKGDEGVRNSTCVLLPDEY